MTIFLCFGQYEKYYACMKGGPKQKKITYIVLGVFFSLFGYVRLLKMWFLMLLYIINILNSVGFEPRGLFVQGAKEFYFPLFFSRGMTNIVLIFN